MADSTARIGGSWIDVTTRYRIGGKWLPAPAVGGTTDAVGSVLWTETFGGTDGTSWSNQWESDYYGGSLDDGATRLIQGNRGRMTPPPYPYGGGTRAYRTQMADTADVDLLMDVFRPLPGSQAALVAVRSNGIPVNSLYPETGYGILLEADGDGALVQVIRCTADAGNVPLYETAFTPSATVPTRVRLRVKGSTIKAKWWLSTDNEPTSWNWTGTDTSLSTGKVWLSNANGGDPTYTDYDNGALRVAA